MPDREEKKPNFAGPIWMGGVGPNDPNYTAEMAYNWGTAGPYGHTARRAGEADLIGPLNQYGEVATNFQGPDGRWYLRAGTSMPEGGNPSDWAYDPQWGWGMEAMAAERATADSQDFFDNYGPLIAAGLGLVTSAPAWGAGLLSGAGGAGGAAAGGFNAAAADIAGLTQMAADAGLTGAAADAFVASGGTLGSTAAGGLSAGLAGDAATTGAPGTGPVDANIGAQQGADAVAQTTYDAAATGGIPGYDPTLTSGVAAGGAPGTGVAGPSVTGGGGGSMIPGIPNQVLSGALQGGLGLFGAAKQASAYSDVANQNAAIGAPYRGYLNASYQPGFDLLSQPGYGDAFNRIADISTRQWAANKGNPAQNPGAAAGILSDVWNQGYLPALSNYRGGLMQAGGMGLNTSSAAQLAGAQNAGGGLNAIGYGLSTALAEPDPFKEYMANLNKKLALTIGGQPA